MLDTDRHDPSKTDNSWELVFRDALRAHICQCFVAHFIKQITKICINNLIVDMIEKIQCRNLLGYY